MTCANTLTTQGVALQAGDLVASRISGRIAFFHGRAAGKPALRRSFEGWMTKTRLERRWGVGRRAAATTFAATLLLVGPVLLVRGWGPNELSALSTGVDMETMVVWCTWMPTHNSGGRFA